MDNAMLCAKVEGWRFDRAVCKDEISHICNRFVCICVSNLAINDVQQLAWSCDETESKPTGKDLTQTIKAYDPTRWA